MIVSGHQTDLATDDLADRVRAHRALAQQPGRTRRGQINDGGRQCAGDVTLDINLTESPNCSRALSIVVAGELPEVLAPDTAIGPTSPNNSNANGCSGIRTTTVPRVSPSSQASDGAWVNTSDRPPGQNASTSSRTTLGTPSIKPSTAAHEPTKTGTGMSGPRRLASRNRRSAWLLNAGLVTDAGDSRCDARWQR